MCFQKIFKRVMTTWTKEENEEVKLTKKFCSKVSRDLMNRYVQKKVYHSLFFAFRNINNHSHRHLVELIE